MTESEYDELDVDNNLDNDKKIRNENKSKQFDLINKIKMNKFNFLNKIEDNDEKSD